MHQMMHMRTTVNIDDDLMDTAADFLGIHERSKLVNAVFAAFVSSESAKRLKALGGSMPDLKVPGRGGHYDPSGSSVFMVADGDPE